MGHRYQLPVAAMVAAALCAFAPRAVGQYAETKLTANDAECGDYFGLAVAIDGDLAVVGAPWKNEGTIEPIGAAYVFRRTGSTWIQEDKLTPGSSTYNLFGRSVGVSGDTVMVGGPYISNVYGNDGAVSVYRRETTGWVETQRLQPNDPHDGALFGTKVAIDGDVAAIAQINDPNLWNDERGAVYVFRRTAGVWVQEQRLVPAGLDAFAGFGWALSVRGDVILAGAYGQSPRGAAYVYRWNGLDWLLEQTLAPFDPGSGSSGFGLSVSVDGDDCVVGVFNSSSPFTGSGYAYAYRFDGSGWILRQILTPPNPEEYGSFGSSVAVQDGRMLVGALDSVPGSPHAGSAYFYQFHGMFWSLDARVTAFDARAFDAFGWNVSLDHTHGVVGAYGRDDADPANSSCQSGGAYIYGIPVDCNRNHVADDEDLADGTSEDCNGNGVPDECDIADCFQGPQCRDCNLNGVPDGCDIAAGAADCGFGDGIPDECQVPPLCSDCPDCDQDSIPDSCERDCDRNGIPDDCDEPCPIPTGACCDHDPFTGCRNGVTFFDCTCPDCEWTQDTACEDVECPVVPIPATGAWALVVLALLLLCGAKLREKGDILLCLTYWGGGCRVW